MMLELMHRLTMEEDGCHRVRIWVSEATGIDPRVFVMQRMPDTDGQPRGRSRFSNVASPADLVELPVEAPDDGTTMWRDSKMDMRVEGKADAMEILDGVAEDVAFLVNGLKRLGDV